MILPTAGLDGPAREVQVEPVKVPDVTPAEQPAPAKQPVKEPVPA